MQGYSEILTTLEGIFPRLEMLRRSLRIRRRNDNVIVLTPQLREEALRKRVARMSVAPVDRPAA
jgi:hypothetical protein